MKLQKLFLNEDEGMYLQILFPLGRLSLQVIALVISEEGLLPVIVPRSVLLRGAGADYLGGELLARYQREQNVLDLSQADTVNS